MKDYESIDPVLRFPLSTDSDYLQALSGALNYTTSSRCDGCDREREGTMLHCATMTGRGDYRVDAVLFLCAECDPDHYQDAKRPETSPLH